jgi:serine/threonine-protein kinase RsbW
VSARASVVHPGTLENLPRFLRFIDDVCDRIDADEGTKYALRLVVEEVCTNLIVYGYKDRPAGPIEVVAVDDDDRVTLVIQDRAPPFDPTNAPAPDLTSDVEHRRVGGLGWHLVKKMIDEIRYVPGTPSGNVLTLVKRKAAIRT